MLDQIDINRGSILRTRVFLDIVIAVYYFDPVSLYALECKQ